MKTLHNIQVGISSLRKSFIFTSEKELKVSKLTLLLLCIEEKVDNILVVLIDWILSEKRTWEKISHNKAGMKSNIFSVIMLLLCSLKWFTKIPKKIGFQRQSHSKSFLASQLERFADKITPIIFRELLIQYTFPTTCFLFTILCFLCNSKDTWRRVIPLMLSLMKPLHCATVIFSLVCHSKHWKLTKALYKMPPTSEY